MLNSERHQAFVWYDEKHGRIHIELKDPLDHKLSDRILARVDKKKAPGEPTLYNADMHYDVGAITHDIYGFDFPA